MKKTISKGSLGYIDEQKSDSLKKAIIGLGGFFGNICNWVFVDRFQQELWHNLSSSHNIANCTILCKVYGL